MSPFFHFNSNFDAQELIKKYSVPALEPNPRYLTNFLGVLIDPKFFPTILDGRAGEVEPIPIPANWHADIAEWGGALRAVDLSGDNFVVAELGCGWGCWLNNTGVAARRTNRRPFLIGVEGDHGHIAFAREACAANGFLETQVLLHHGIAGARDGRALFPRQDTPGEKWGLEPILDATLIDRAKARLTGRYDELPLISLTTLTREHERIDLLHIDIQGGEADLIENSQRILNAKIAYLVIGTHSREIEGRIFAGLRNAGWALEIERPAILALPGGQPHVTVDGVQGWRNPRLLPL